MKDLKNKRQIRKSGFPGEGSFVSFAEYALLAVIIVIFSFAYAEASTYSGGSGAVYIKIKDRVQVRGDVVLLKDISIIKAERGLKYKLENLKVAKSPSPGKESQINSGRVRLALSGVSGLPGNSVITIPDVIYVTRAFQEIPEESLERIFRNYIASNTSSKDFQVTGFKHRGLKPLPVGKLKIDVSSRKDARELKGRVTLTVNIKVDNKPGCRVTLSAWIDRYENIVLAARSIPKNSVVSQSDIILKRVNLSKAPRNIAFLPNEVVGKRLKQSVKQGGYFRVSTLVVPPLIYKGDRVKILAKSGALKVVTIGIAKSDGGMGRQIMVENINSKKRVMGRVIDSSTVEVLF